MRSTSLLIVLLGLAACSSSGGTQGPYGPHLDSIAEVNRAIAEYEAIITHNGVPALEKQQVNPIFID